MYLQWYFADAYAKLEYIILVRTIVELVKNKTHYIDQCSKFVGPFNKALQRACNNNRFCELYELVALANVLQCEIQSVYPYIDYRAEMKIMNAVYKPTMASVLKARRVVIFWTSNKDELLVKARPGSGGIWSPNHFVPLIQANRSNRVAIIEESIITPEVECIKISIREKLKIIKLYYYLDPAKNNYKKQQRVIDSKSRVFTTPKC